MPAGAKRVDVDADRARRRRRHGGPPLVGRDDRGPTRPTSSSDRSSDAPQSSSRNGFSGGASARLTPTHTAPSRIAPWNATTTSASLGSDAATRSPAPHAEVAQRVGGPVGRPVELGVGEALRRG